MTKTDRADAIFSSVIAALSFFCVVMVGACIATVREDSVTVAPDYCQMIRAAMLIRNEQLDCDPISLSCPELMDDVGIINTDEVATMCINRVFAVQECKWLPDALDACGHLGQP